MKCEMDRLTLQQELETMKSKYVKDKHEAEAEDAHERWLNEQKRLLKEAKIKKILAKEIGAATGDGASAGGYEALQGFHLAVDAVLGASRRVKALQVTLGLYNNSAPVPPSHVSVCKDTEDMPSVRQW